MKLSSVKNTKEFSNIEYFKQLFIRFFILMSMVLAFVFSWINSAFASSSTELIDEVLAESKTPRLFDWHSEGLGLEYSSFSINERNNFESSGYSIALRSSLSSRLFGLFGIRFIETNWYA